MEAATYHITEFEDQVFDEIASHVDLKVLPNKHVSDEYVGIYLSSVHPFFQVIFKDQFLQDYEKFWATGIPPEGGLLWQAMLNLMLALGCVYAKYTGRQIDPAAELEFFLRARMLSLEPLNFLQVPQRGHVQLTAMFAMYLLASNRVNRAWLMIGTSIRYAQNLAYHLSNTDHTVPDPEKELHIRLWHSISSLEHLLCFLTGRPLSLRVETVSIDLPRTIEETYSRNGYGKNENALDERGPQASHELETFCKIIQLDRVLADTLVGLYTASTATATWADIQQRIENLNIKLSTWKAYLPDHYGLRNIEDEYGVSKLAPFSETSCLALRYFSTRILINRPSLCSRPHNNRAMPDQSKRSHETDIENAKQAIRAAQGIIRVLISRHLEAVYDETPWWCVLHFLVQACALITMELCDDSEHLPEESDRLLQDAQAGMNVLYEMQKGNAAAKAAYSSLSRLLKVALCQREQRQADQNMNVDRHSDQGYPNPNKRPSLTTGQNSISTFNILNMSRVSGITLTLSPFMDYSPADDSMSMASYST